MVPDQEKRVFHLLRSRTDAPEFLLLLWWHFKLFQ